MSHRRNAIHLPSFALVLSHAAVLGGTLLLAACAASPSAKPTATAGATPTLTAIPATPTPSIVLGSQACQGALASVSWASLIPGFDASSQKIGTVTCGDLKRDGHQEALVPVQYDGTGGILDFYVFDAPSGGGAPTIIYSRANATGNLYEGAVAISDDNTIISSEVDQNSCINRNVPGNAAYLPDLAREWRWNGSTFAQVAFPGIFPAFTRFGAQSFERQTVDAGSSLWSLDPVQETNTFATQWLFGGAIPGATLVSSTATTAQTHVLQFTLNLQRLAYPAHPAHAIWVVTGIQGAAALTLTAPTTLASVTSPLAISGSGYTFEAGNFQTALWTEVGVPGAPVTHCALGSGSLHSAASTPPAAAFSGALTYSPTIHVPEDALLWVDEPSAKGDGSFASLQLVKLLAS